MRHTTSHNEPHATYNESHRRWAAHPTACDAQHAAWHQRTGLMAAISLADGTHTPGNFAELMEHTNRTRLSTRSTYPYAHLRAGVWKAFESLSNCTMMSFSACTHTPIGRFNRRWAAPTVRSATGLKTALPKKRDWSAHHLGDFEPKARHWVKVMHDVCAVLHRLFHLALRRNATRGATLQHSAARRRIVASKSGAWLPR